MKGRRIGETRHVWEAISTPATVSNHHRRALVRSTNIRACYCFETLGNTFLATRGPGWRLYRAVGAMAARRCCGQVWLRYGIIDPAVSPGLAAHHQGGRGTHRNDWHRGRHIGRMKHDVIYLNQRRCQGEPGKATILSRPYPFFMRSCVFTNRPGAHRVLRVNYSPSVSSAYSRIANPRCKTRLSR